MEHTEKRYAYQHKSEKDVFGLLDATDYKDARGHLGSCFEIKVCQIPVGFNQFNLDLKAEFVNKIFTLQTAPRGSDRQD